MHIENQKLFDLPSSCKRLGDGSVWTMRKHIALGNVPVIRLGKRIFLTEETIQKIAREGLPSLKTGKK
jgi:hypothetical protein